MASGGLKCLHHAAVIIGTTIEVTTTEVATKAVAAGAIGAKAGIILAIIVGLVTAAPAVLDAANPAPPCPPPIYIYH